MMIEVPTWSEGEFESDVFMRTLLSGCAPLRSLCEKAMGDGYLTYDEQIALRHTLGHLPQGIDAVNFLFRKCTDIPDAHWMKSRFRGSCISCAKLRKRLPKLTSEVECCCEFDSENTYDNPLLHIRDLPNPKELLPGEKSDEDIARAWGAQRRRVKTTDGDLSRIERELVRRLQGISDRTLTLSDGTVRLVDEEGVTRLEWEINEASSDSPPKNSEEDS